MNPEDQQRNKNIEIFCDGACVPNPGFMGGGIVLGNEDHVISQYFGSGTNQLAELLALRTALELATSNDHVFSDSKYALSVASGTWRARVYLDLILEMRNLVEHKRVTLHWLRGHDGHTLQGLADTLAKRAAMTRRSTIDPPSNLLSRTGLGGSGHD